ncbi:glycosyltransferase [Tieghemostelium lacteum]|uniref:Alpha-1,3-glucosyltransferase n=1 Tax=Tieghemostelium lacteum TaxID=361077 RepID=A0A152A4T1_TIELA|nr:glycosyltransferase [Tieghemostelium lacteum]|eukprot:KYR01097.1 glycosyltransferase [Tieghemostelium lacteum]
MKYLVISLFLLVSIMIRYLVGLHSYSGQSKPPMYGDYEAQRHWMEITTKLPVHQWYFNGTDNDLMYWGLDYPPLTAYISWVFGKVGEYIEPQSMELYSSRGYQSESSKLFMRLTVILSDIVIWIPSVVFFVQTFYQHQPLRKKIQALLFISLQPGLLLIDHGHFQYNGISLGLALFGITFLLKKQDLLGSLFFVLSLNYKQMSLYYAPAFFFFLLFSNFKVNQIGTSIIRILKIGLTVVVCFIICWLPFLSIEQSSQVLFRLFPFARGLYEDKVANFWCFISILVNLKNILTVDKIIKLCTICTLTGLVPMIYSLLRSNSIFQKNVDKVSENQRTVFIYSLINSSFSFFLFSFQVHEKSILLVTLPVSLLILKHPFMSWSFGLVSTFSMFPLLFKDGLVIPYLAIMIVYTVIGYQQVQEEQSTKENQSTLKKVYLYLGLIIPMVGIHIIYQFIKPPTTLPYLWLLLVCNFSFSHFITNLFYFVYKMFTIKSSENSRPNSKQTKIK